MENVYLEVDFEKYCKTCEHKDLDEKCDPCCECLDHDCKPIKVTDYRCHRDFYVRAEYTYIPIFRRNMPYHRRNF